VFLGIPIFLGGGVLYPQVVTVATIPTPGTNWTFVRAFAATSNDTSQTETVPLATCTLGSSIVNIRFVSHGFTAPGQIFQVNYAFAFTDGGPSVPAGSYPILSIIDGNNFTIEGQTVSTNGSDTARESPTGLAGEYLVFQYLISQTFPSFVDWYTDNFGGTGLFSFTQGGIFQYVPPVALGQTTAIITPVLNAPLVNNGMLVAMPQAQIVAWGSTPILGSSTQDPLLIRWCDAGDPTDWTATSTNQAGSYRLSSGSRIIGGIQLAITTVIFTDTDVWMMQYVGAPFVYDFTIVASGCGLLAPKGAAVLGSSVHWISQKQFYMAGSGGVQVVPCPEWDIIFNNIDPANVNKLNAGANSAFGEVIYNYASLSGGTGEIDSYVKFKPATNEWDYGSNNSSPGCSQYARTAWMDQSVFGTAMGGDLNMLIQQHEIGYDADGTAMAGVFAETGYADISDGDSIMTANEIVPDLKWFGNVPGAIMVTLKSLMYPQGPVYQKGPYGMDMQNRHIRPRIRARSIALRFDWIARLGYSARIGAVRFRAALSGKRP
jgi:hypothetical protein